MFHSPDKRTERERDLKRFFFKEAEKEPFYIHISMCTRTIKETCLGIEYLNVNSKVRAHGTYIILIMSN